MSRRLSIMPVPPKRRKVISGKPPRLHQQSTQLTTSCPTSDRTRKSRPHRSPSPTWRIACIISSLTRRDQHLQNIQRTILCQTLESMVMSRRLSIMPVPPKRRKVISGKPPRLHQQSTQLTTSCPTSDRTRSLRLPRNLS